MELFLKSLCFSSIGVYFLLPPFCSLTSSRTQVSIFLSFSYLHPPPSFLPSLGISSLIPLLCFVFLYSLVVWYMCLYLNTSQMYSLRLEAWGRLRQKESYTKVYAFRSSGIWRQSWIRKEATCFKTKIRDFPGGPVVKTLCFHCRGQGFDPWLGN